MTTRTALLVLLLAAAAHPAAAQRPLVTLVALDERMAVRLSRAFVPGAAERLYCVTKWETREGVRGIPVLAVLDVREDGERAGGDGITMAASACRDSTGEALPTIHTHPSGTCQASDSDVLMYTDRMAAFDGIVCAPRAVVWYFARQIVAAWSWEAQEERAAAQKLAASP